MKKVWFMIFMTAWVCSSIFSSGLANPISSTDAWEYTNIQSISTTGLFPTFSAYDIFGASESGIEPGHTVFKDSQPAGYVHQVQWTLYDTITLGSFNLYAMHDGAGNLMDDRGISYFKLEALVDSVWVTLYEQAIEPQNVEGSYPVYGGGEYYTYIFALEIYQTVSPVTAQTWRASFTQYGSTNPTGPRIVELDGFVYEPPEVIPEPASLLLLGSAIMGFLRRKLAA